MVDMSNGQIFEMPWLAAFECETHIDGPWNDWVRLKYEMTDYWTGQPLEIDDKIFACRGLKDERPKPTQAAKLACRVCYCLDDSTGAGRQRPM
jgi:hypothetical protein